MARASDWEFLLRQSPPRRVPAPLRAAVLRGRRPWQIGLVATALFCLTLAAAFFPYGIVDDIRLDVSGQPARGEVESAVYANRTIGDDIIARKKLVFSVRFRFTDAHGQSYATSSLYFGHLETGTPVMVEYLPDDPEVARLRDGFFVPGGRWEVLWSLVFVLPPLFGYWNDRRWQRERTGLLVHGLVASGRIERAWRDHQEDDVGGWVEVSYATAGGPVRVRETFERDPYRRACDIAARGHPVQVLHLPDAPRQHIVLDLVR
ncbi:MAG: hypothetical protein RIM84_23395 [Alphaproteobacteria bacterium]